MSQAAPARRWTAPLSAPVAGSVLAVAVGAIVLGMGLLVVYPVGRVLYDAVFADGSLNARQVVDTLADPALKPALLNTAFLIVGAGLIALILGSTLAWINERTDARIGWAADVLPVVPLLVPALAVAIGWEFLLAPRAGFLNLAYRAAFERDASDFAGGPLNVYSLAGMVFVTVILVIPFVYLVVSAALKNVDPALEEASRMSGVGPLGTLVKVTLPSVRNALATAAVLLVITIVAMFSVGAIIGLPARIDVLSVLIFRVIYASTPPRFGEAVVLSSFMLLAVQAAVLVEHRIARRGFYARVGGRAHSRSRVSVGRWRWPVRLAVLLYLASATVLPVAALALVSLQGFWSEHIPWSHLSLKNYVELLGAQSVFRQALADSLGLAIATATTLMIIAALIAYFVHHVPGTLARVVNAIATLPSSMPHTVVAIGFLVTLGVGRVSLAGTLLLLFLAYLVLFLPVASRAAGTAVAQVGDDLWECSLMSGATPARSFVKVLLPLTLGGLSAGWVIVFANTVSEISAGVFLSGTGDPVVGPIILLVFQGLGGSYPQLAALALVVTLVQIVTVFAVLGLVRARQRYRSA